VVRGVLWDVGNVIVRWNPRNLYSQIFKNPAEVERFLAETDWQTWNLRADAGVPMAENVTTWAAAYPHYAGPIGLWHSRWSDMLGGLIPETVSAMTSLGDRGVRQFGLTNMETECWPIIAGLSPVFGLMEDVVVSGREKVLKPDRRIYEIALERSGLTAGDLLFIDDSAANIAGAEALGFDTHLFDNPSTLLGALRGRGLL
jgi:2-haloacid dehalogenase/putative hydrolase of the HAD superfamily